MSVYTVCYDELYVFDSKEKAKDFFGGCYYASEGAEQSRYASILIGLDYNNIADDGVSKGCKKININVDGDDIISCELENKKETNDAIKYYQANVLPVLIVANDYGVDFLKRTPFEHFDSDEETDIYWNKIPILGSVPCGEPTEAIEEIIGYIEVLPNMAKDHFGLIAKGDSMAPKIEKGDTLIIKKQSTVESGDVAIVKVNGDEATCKKIVFTDEGITLISLNPNYEPRFFTNAQIESLPIKIIGKVVEIRRKL